MRPAPTSSPKASARLEQRARGAALDREEAHRHQGVVVVAQVARQHRRDVAEDLRMGFGVSLEIRARDEAQLGFPDRRHRGRSRRPVDQRQLADQRARPQDGEDALAPRRRRRRHLQKPVGDPIAAVAGIAGAEQRLMARQHHLAGLAEQRGREIRGQDRGRGVACHAHVLHVIQLCLVAARTPSVGRSVPAGGSRFGRTRRRNRANRDGGHLLTGYMAAAAGPRERGSSSIRSARA